MKNIFVFILLFSFLSCKEKTSQIKKATTAQLHEATIEELQVMMEDGRLTALDLTYYYIDRINRFDEAGPKLNSVLTVNPDALAIAAELDKERASGKIRGPLHGIPILIKDNIETKDQMSTTAGSLLLKNHRASSDAFIVKQLRNAGAVLLGKTNLSEWANFRSTGSSSGWSSLGGQTLNPYNQDKSPCGSSAGSGVAVAADLCAVAVGTETDGSIICPSAVNGIVGIKPTVGLWSRSGIVPISHTQDTPGPMARTVKDAAILLTAGVGVDPLDDKTANQKDGIDFTLYCKKGALDGKRIGVDPSFLNDDSKTGEIFRQGLSDLQSLGAEIVEVPYRNALKGVGEFEYKILLYEFKSDIEEYLSTTDLPYQTLADLIRANEENEDSILNIFGQEIFEQAEQKGDLSSSDYQNALKRCTERVGYVIDSVMAAQNLTAFVTPSLGPAWDIDHENGDQFNGPSGYSIAAQAGYPSITVPMGFLDGLPVGITFVGQAFQEGSLIGMAYDYEVKTKRRKSPEFK